MGRRRLKLSVGEVTLADGGSKDTPLVVLAHGAGASIDSPFMEHFAAGLIERGVRAWRFNFPYMEQARKTPDRQQVLEQTYREVLDAARAVEPPGLFAGGKSMGGRIASYVADGLDGLVFLGYPLHPPGRPDRMRDEHLRELKVPMLFVEGTRDPFCPLETLEKVRSKLRAPTDVVVIDGGDHSYKVRKSSGRSTEEVWDEAVDAIAGWVRKRTRRR